MWKGAASHADPLGHDDRVAHVVDVIAEHHELVASEARDGVARAHEVAQALCRLHQQQVPDVVAEAVVYRLEAIEIEEEDRTGELAALDTGKRDLEPLEEHGAVRQAGQSIVGGLVRELELRLLALDGIADRATEQVAVRVALDEIVLSALVHGLDGHPLVLLAAQDDDRNVGRAGSHGLQALESRGVGQRKVQQDATKVLLDKGGLGIGDRATVVDQDRIAELLHQEVPDEQRVLRAVLDQRDPNRPSTRPRRGPDVADGAGEPLIDAHRPPYSDKWGGF
jgi:hypothetical protein